MQTSIYIVAFFIGVLGFNRPTVAEVAVGGVAVGGGGAVVGGVAVGYVGEPPLVPLLSQWESPSKRDLYSLSESALITIPLFESSRRVERIYFKAKVSPEGSSFDVVTKRGTYRAKQNRGRYVVEVNETLKEFQVRTGSGTRLEILDVEAKCEETSVTESTENENQRMEIPPHDVAIWLGERARILVRAIRPHVDPELDYVPYLFHIKQAADRVVDAAERNGDLSEVTKRSLIRLRKEILEAEPLIASLERREDSSAEDASDLWWLADKIRKRME